MWKVSVELAGSVRRHPGEVRGDFFLGGEGSEEREREKGPVERNSVEGVVGVLAWGRKGLCCRVTIGRGDFHHVAGYK